MRAEWEEKRNKILQVRLKLPGGLRKEKKMTDAISGGGESATRSEILIHEGFVFTGSISRETNRNSEITPRWARCENHPKKSDGEGGKKRERNGERRVNANVGLLSK